MTREFLSKKNEINTHTHARPNSHCGTRCAEEIDFHILKNEPGGKIMRERLEKFAFRNWGRDSFWQSLNLK